MMSKTDLEEQLDEDLLQTATWLFGAFLLGWTAVILRFVFLAIQGHKLGISTSLLGLMCVGFIWTLAWLAAGFLFGFIFGVPKVIAQSATTDVALAGIENARPSPRLKVNTNLEDISDWLTKVLVGATLTQIMKIPGAISTAAVFMAGQDLGYSAIAFNGAILLYYLSLGFLSGYILTRMFFARAFALAG